VGEPSSSYSSSSSRLSRQTLISCPHVPEPPRTSTLTHNQEQHAEQPSCTPAAGTEPEQCLGQAPGSLTCQIWLTPLHTRDETRHWAWRNQVLVAHEPMSQDPCPLAQDDQRGSADLNDGKTEMDRGGQPTLTVTPPVQQLLRETTVYVARRWWPWLSLWIREGTTRPGTQDDEGGG
jgi:hypothetical protein